VGPFVVLPGFSVVPVPVVSVLSVVAGLPVVVGAFVGAAVVLTDVGGDVGLVVGAAVGALVVVVVSVGFAVVVVSPVASIEAA